MKGETNKSKRPSSAARLHAAAELRLKQLFGSAFNASSDGFPPGIANAVEKIINGKHKTFRYMLFTALLAAVTDRKLHPRCLQVNANVEGAFDARSLCQKVIVPFERTFLQGRLGASSEPFANKSARFAMIDRGNNVRKGADAELLAMLCDVLDAVKAAKDATRRQIFCYALSVILKRPPNAASVMDLAPIKSPTADSDALFDFLEAHTKGVAAVAVLAAFFRMFYDKGVKVIAHPSTESGASSNEVGDIDLKFKDGRRYAVEVKDKTYADIDVNHACERAVEAGVGKVVFATGANAGKVRVQQGVLSEYWAEKGIELTFLDVGSALAVAAALCNGKERVDFANRIYQVLVEMNAPDDVRAFFRKCFACEEA